MDVAKDGIGEYGTFAEMTGTEGVRTSADGASRGAVLSPCVLSPALANVDANGIVTKSGYEIGRASCRERVYVLV